MYTDRSKVLYPRFVFVLLLIFYSMFYVGCIMINERVSMFSILSLLKVKTTWNVKVEPGNTHRPNNIISVKGSPPPKTKPQAKHSLPILKQNTPTLNVGPNWGKTYF